ncbi:MAG: hypothetical protein U0939_12450 [Pirellulales bacterium]
MRWSQCAAVSALSVFVLVLAVGCGDGGPATASVTGKLTIGGQPANDVTVNFNPVDPNGVPASGVVSNGTYTLSSGSTGKAGAVPGKYKITLTQNASAATEEAYSASGGNAPSAPKAPFAAEFADPGKTTIEKEVKAGSNTIDIDIPGA